MKASKIILEILLFPLKLCAIILIYIYKVVISPVIPKSCIYTPTCSTYMLKAIIKFGIIRGFFIGFKRIIRCRAGKTGGLDPVPDNILGECKWIV